MQRLFTLTTVLLGKLSINKNHYLIVFLRDNGQVSVPMSSRGYSATVATVLQFVWGFCLG